MTDLRRSAIPALSEPALSALALYERHLREQVDVQPGTLRNYLSDLRLFMAWFENQEHRPGFTPAALTTPALIRYRTYLQTTLKLKPASTNRTLVSLKRYFAWATDQGLTQVNPARAVKLLGLAVPAPRHLSEQEEEALVAAVNASGNLRDRTLITLMLHTGLRAREVCLLKRAEVHVLGRNSSVQITGKGNKYREVPLNSTARQALANYLAKLEGSPEYLFPSEKTGSALTERALGHLVQKYARLAHLENVSPHDLRHRFGYKMAQSVPLHRLAQIMGHSSLDTTMVYIRATQSDLQAEVEKIAWH